MSTFSPLISSIEKADVESAEKSQPIKSLQGVDTASCLKLLIDVYSHLLSPSATPKTPLMLLNECAKSVCPFIYSACMPSHQVMYFLLFCYLYTVVVCRYM